MNNSIRIDFNESLGRKMLVSAVFGIVIVLTAFTLFAVVRESGKAKEGLRDEGRMLSGLLAHGAVVGVYTENAALLKEASRGILSLRHVTKVFLYRADRKPLYAGDRAPGQAGESALPEEAVRGLTTADSVDIRETGDAFEFIRRVVLESAAEQDEALYFNDSGAGRKDRTIGFVRITLSKEAYHKEIVAIIVQHAGIMTIFIVASIVLIYFRLKPVTRPLEQLTANVKALGRGQRVDPVPVETGDEVGKLAQAFNVMVIARGEAEESLRESEERYRQLVELSPDAIYVQLEGRIVFINTAGLTLLGASEAGEIMGSRVLDRVCEEDRESMMRRVAQIEEGMDAASLLPVRYLRPGGTIVEAEAAAAPLPFDGKRAALVIARDVTDRKSLEELVKEYQRELQSAETAISSLESHVEERERHLIAADLHDHVGQNLALALLKLGFLQKAGVEPGVLEHLAAIRELIMQTLQYTRSLTVELSPPVLMEIGFLAALESLAEGMERVHDLRIVLADDGSAALIEERLRSMLFRSVRELLMNVVKHARARTAVITLNTAGGRIRISVKDDGIGFDASPPAGRAAGFGLYSIRERMKREGGSFEISGMPGAGTEAVLAVPVSCRQSAGCQGRNPGANEEAT